MARKHLGRTLSGIAVLATLLLMLTSNVHAESFGGERVMFSISGTTGIGEVELRGFPSGSIQSDATGYYSVKVGYGWKGTVKPVKEGYSFSPNPMSFSPVKGNLDGKDFVANIKRYTISGTLSGAIGHDGVLLDGFPGGPIEVGSDGRFEVDVDYGWSGEITPIKEGIAFTPRSLPYEAVKHSLSNQNFEARTQTYKISGRVTIDNVSLAGVQLQGFPGPGVVTTNPDGTYSVEVPYKWHGKVTAVKEGYIFEPGQQEYQDMLMPMSNQDYYGKRITYVLTGNLGVDNATLKGFNNDADVIYGGGGHFEARVNHGSSLILTPKLEGYTFDPPDRRLPQVKNNLDGLNFVAKEIFFSIKGSTGLPGVELKGLSTADGLTVISDQQGRYTATVRYGWSGQVTPVLEGYSFNPPTKPYNNLTRDMTNEIYRPTRQRFAISGTISDLEGVQLQGLPVPVRTTRGGVYSTQVEWDWSGKVKPFKPGYEFDPPSFVYTNVRSEQMAQDYEARLKQYTISGTVEDQFGAVEGAQVTTDLGTVTTGYDGRYELLVSHGWSGTLSIEKEGYTFSPAKRLFPTVTQDVEFNVTGRAKTFTIIGEVIIWDEPIEGVTITATKGGSTTKTDKMGRYTVTVPYNWSGEIIPEKEGFNFHPASKPYYNVTDDIDNVTDDIDETKPKETPAVGTSIPVDSSTPDETPEVTSEVTGVSQAPSGTGQDPSSTAGSEDNERIKELEAEIERMREENADSDTPPAYTSERGPLVEENDYQGEMLSMVLSDMSYATGVPINVDPAANASVTCHIPAVPLEDALTIALAGTGYVWKKADYGGYMVLVPDVSAGAFSLEADTRPYKLRYLDGITAQNLLPPALRKFVQAQKESYLVTVTGAGSQMDRIIQILDELDAKPSTVFLTTRIVSMTKTNLLELGVDWGWPTLSTGLGVFSDSGTSSTTTPWGVQIGYSSDASFTDALTMSLNLLQEKGQAQLVSVPKVFAMDGEKATLKVLNEQYFMLTPTETSSNYYSRAELETIKTGTTLEIVPNISDNNEIYLQVAVELSDTVATDAETGLPYVTRRNYDSKVLVKDGGTVVVAGLSKNNQTTSRDSVPGLSQLPLLGKLFKSDSNNDEQQDVAIFITAELVHEHQQYRGNQSSSVSRADTVPNGMNNAQSSMTGVNGMQPSVNRTGDTMNTTTLNNAYMNRTMESSTAGGSSGNFNRELYDSLYGTRR